MPVRKNCRDKVGNPGCSSVGTSCGPQSNFDQMKFHKEVNWCVEQIRLGLLNNKTNQKQIKDSKAIIKTLISTKAPLVRKRQVMHQHFGDYRRKVEEADEKWQKDALNLVASMDINEVSITAINGKFIKNATIREPLYNNCVNELNNSFQFNFEIDETK